MNQAFATTARILAWLLALALVALPVVAVMKGWIGAERWPLRVLRINDGLEQVDVARVRETVLPHAQRGFFAVDLVQAQRDVSRLPWVAGVEVRKRWPDVLEVRIGEHVPFARWGEGRLLSTRGRLFSAEGVEVPGAMPRFDGPDARANEVVALYNEARELFRPSGFEIAGVVLDARGSWLIRLSSGTEVLVGSQEAKLRLARFARMLPRLVANRTEPLARADLRYTNGFALVWAKPGLGIGDSGLETALHLSPPQTFPNPQSPIPNPGSNT
ncbi:cell division protein FtsQ/DivIB [Luteimonas sp. FCS-9]|uniref:cell division protein FtsQ/DivIB n=1 Tax=Luteimonas sp. FCS-9 TaxID=1547516 RepID=UPI00063E8ECE|nr:cell division protein FtsQ/DivIB [Luteimonas sp. FCS-9]KLJ02342.1 cell division protein FtsQ [Luteimonas sp. FCS-9]